ncbi:hypothetical protein SAY87_005847 [Trapa incisa]|uniref:DYW domain-containing protein n=1 Tax=Trapa incisa TaxID=236973 RepID=A0AAN7Q867_9MYRT|nr:hypothetical protein SAY87_005847 [Trapa incisa]
MGVPSPSPISDLYANVLQTSIKSQDLLAGKCIHAKIIKSGLHLGVFLMNSLTNFYVKTERFVDARQVFDEMPVKNVFSWNTVLSMYAKHGMIETAHRVFSDMPERDPVSWTTMILGFNRICQFGKAIQLFSSMITHRMAPTQYTITNVLASCAAHEALSIGRKIHSLAVKLGFGGCVPVANSLLNMYAKSGDVSTANIVFGRMKLKNKSTCNVMISLHMNLGQIDLALAQFEKMEERDIVSWNSMITGYNQHGHDFEALNMLSRMLRESSLQPDKFTLGSALSACSNLESLNHGKEIHTYLIKAGFNTSGAVGNALIAMYSKSGQVGVARTIVEKNKSTSLNVIAFTAILDGYLKVGDVTPAREIFNLLMDRDVVLWTAMIVGYVQNGLSNDAVEIFRAMINEGPRPNSYTLAAILSASSSLASLNHGKEIHASAIRTGEVYSVSVGNGLINVYAKAGNIDSARRVFVSVCYRRDTVSWTSMIAALAQHGLGEDAIELFDKMLAIGIKPDHITYVSVLSACANIGLVERGQKYYGMMVNVHRIEPIPSHYVCMIDLFGRAGLLEEARKFIEDMPVDPDIAAWASLLLSCKVYKNLELAELAAERLLALDPGNSGAYSTLANMYSACGRWEKAARIRKTMKERGVKKEQGSSWVQIKGTVHVFGANDSLHPQKDEIYKLIAKIWREIKEMGFIPDTDTVLHDLEEEVKEQILRHHSEKLAITFGLLSTPEGTTLRIMKNLRVCNDCHLAIKYISKLVGREIIVRDSTRFHHFRDGLCSCREFW